MRIVLFISVILVLWGCAGTPREVKVAQKQAKVAYEMQKPVVVRTSIDDNRPAWTKQSSYSDDANIYFTGGYLNGADYPLTVRTANAEAIKVACQGISQFIRAEFSGYIQGTNQAGDRLDKFASAKATVRCIQFVCFKAPFIPFHMADNIIMRCKAKSESAST